MNKVLMFTVFLLAVLASRYVHAEEGVTATSDLNISQDVSMGLGYDSLSGLDFSLGYEKQFYKYHSLRLLIYSGRYTYTNAQRNSYGIEGSWRYYLHSKKHPQKNLGGWFLGPVCNLRYIHWSYSSPMLIAGASSDNDITGLGLLGGYQWIFTGHLVLAAELGGTYNLIFGNQDDLNAGQEGGGMTTYFRPLTLGWAF